MRRIRPFIFILAILLPIFFYLGWTQDSLGGWVFTTTLFVLILTFPIMRKNKYLLQLTYLSMGVLTYVLVFSIIRDLISLFGPAASTRWIYIFSSVTVILGSFIARGGPRLVTLKIPDPNLPPEIDGLRIVQISDLHIGPTIRKEYVERVVEKVNSLQADIIALTGDIGDGPVDTYRDDIAPLGKLQAKLGVFYVPGNHEFYWNANEWMNVMNNLKSIVLLNRGKKVSLAGRDILVAGISDPAGMPRPDMILALKGGPEASYKILLSHRPGPALEAAKLGFNLQLSGHTHGGQFFPWTIVVRFVHKHHLGLHRVQKLWLNVNSGTGSWGPLLRLGTVSEITQLEIFHSGKSLE